MAAAENIETNAKEYVGTAMRGRLDDLKLLLLLAQGARTLDREAAQERLYELPLCVERTVSFEVVLGTGGPDDRLVIECDTIDHGLNEDSRWGPYEIRGIFYRYSWEGSADVELRGDDLEAAEAFARQVVPELVE